MATLTADTVHECRVKNNSDTEVSDVGVLITGGTVNIKISFDDAAPTIGNMFTEFANVSGSFSLATAPNYVAFETVSGTPVITHRNLVKG